MGLSHTSHAKSRRKSEVRAAARVTDGTRSESSGSGVASPGAWRGLAGALDSWVSETFSPGSPGRPICKKEEVRDRTSPGKVPAAHPLPVLPPSLPQEALPQGARRNPRGDSLSLSFFFCRMGMLKATGKGKDHLRQHWGSWHCSPPPHLLP